MNGPRYIAKQQLTFVAGTCLRAWRVYDLADKKYVGPNHKLKPAASRLADKRNAAVLRKADAYRKAKDNG